MTLRIDVVFPRLPPAIDGIGDHSAILARELARQGAEVRLVGRITPADADIIRQRYGVEAVNGWPSGRLRDVGPLLRVLADGGADVVLLQFEQFAYGTRGFNPAISSLFRRLARAAPGIQRVLYAHENYTYPGSVSHTVMWTYQRRQFRRLVRDAQRVLVSTEAWARRDRLDGAVVLPVFSNIPVAAARQSAEPGTIAPAVWFGYLDDARAPYFTAALAVLRERTPDLELVYAGIDAARAEALAGDAGFRRLTVAVRPPAAEVSQLLSRSRLALAPFPDGASSRRGSMMAALEHGCCVVTNVGPSTDATTRQLVQDGMVVAAGSSSAEAFATALADALALDEQELSAIGARAAACYAERFAADAVARRLLLVLGSAVPPS